nr:uncharacterized protein CI109_001372 [Kwoniella shandongensis]KAA5529970.1 hypothetical protein CI109_001372 [Kwoniella shandongensis]
MDSSSTSSPFSSRSTIPSSSPEATNGGGEPSNGMTNGHGGYAKTTGQDVMQGMQALLSSFNGTSFSPQPTSSYNHNHNRISSPPQQQDVKPTILPDVKPFASVPHPMTTSSRPSNPSPIVETPSHSLTNTSSMNGSHGHGGLRADPPKRMYEVEGLQKVTPSLDELVGALSSRNQLLLQGDPLYSDKSRVETAIRVIIDILRFAPVLSPLPSIHPSVLPILPRDPNGNVLMTFERIATFHGLRLQAGTTTKASSKKQLQAGPIPKEHLAYVETAVYMSGDNGKRVYVCKRCRNREARRRASKEVNRKRQPNSDSDTSSTKPKPRQSLVPPSQDFITSENPDQYDPHRSQQTVEEPPWDPDHRDWRHEIVLFNSPPEVKIDDGSCNWLPFRVVCYGKCHGEKVGFKIKFTLRTWDGRIIATSTTKPIRITDDHKTEPKIKTKVDGMTSTLAQPPVARARKGRQSTASSRRQSPTPSESESVQSMSLSEAGAVLQKQTPSVRAGKPYERPPSQSPAMSTIPMDSSSFSNSFQRQHSSTSLHSLHQPEPVAQPIQPAQPSSIDYSRQQAANTVSPGALQRPQFAFDPMSMMNGLPGHGHTSAPSSNLTSPVTQTMSLGGHDDILFANSMQSSNSIMSSLGLNGTHMQQPQQAMLFSQDQSDVEMGSVVTSGLEDLFVASSQTSLSSSMDDRGSLFSAFADDRSSAMFSESGLPPPTDIDQFLDYTGGEHSDVSNPFQPDLAMVSPPSGSAFPPLPFDELHLSPAANAMDLSPAAQAQQDAQLQDMLAAIAQGPQAQITHVIPGDGPMAGGTKIAIAGRAFQPGMVIVFGQRPAPTDFVSDGFVQCKLPPSSFPGEVEVTVQGAMKMPGAAPMLFRYNDMDKDLMRLALEVRNQYQGSSSDAAYRLAHQVATRSVSASDWSERSSSNSPMSGASPGDAVDDDDHHSHPTNSGSKSSEKSDLQSTIIAFLASLDENAPGSLRASGAINHHNEAHQTLLHIATVMGYHRLVRRLIVVGAHLDVQDTNGYTPLAFAALCGRHTCARVLIEAGASYDRPTSYGEMPLDLAKYGEHSKVEALLLSAVWSTSTAAAKEEEEREIAAEISSSRSFETSSEIDDDNPSSGSEIEDEIDHERIRLTRKRGKKIVGKGKQRSMSINKSDRDRRSPKTTRHASLDATPQATPFISAHPTDEPPPYAPPASRVNMETDHSSWMSRTLTAIPHPHPNFKLPGAVWDHLPIPSSIFGPEKQPMVGDGANADQEPQGWVAFPAPSWETLQKMASPEEVKLFTQAMAAAAFNAVVQSGVTTSAQVGNVGGVSSRKSARSATMVQEEWEGDQRLKERRRRRSGGAGKEGRRSGSVSPGEKVVKHVKRDRMLYLFWLPVLLFVGFWLLVTALPIATGFSLIYARQITRAIKQRM